MGVASKKYDITACIMGILFVAASAVTALWRFSWEMQFILVPLYALLVQELCQKKMLCNMFALISFGIGVAAMLMNPSLMSGEFPFNQMFIVGQVTTALLLAAVLFFHKRISCDSKREARLLYLLGANAAFNCFLNLLFVEEVKGELAHLYIIPIIVIINSGITYYLFGRYSDERLCYYSAMLAVAAFFVVFCLTVAVSALLTVNVITVCTVLGLMLGVWLAKAVRSKALKGKNERSDA